MRSMCDGGHVVRLIRSVSVRVRGFGMATWSYVDFSNASSQRLADLSGVASDLRAAQEMCSRLESELKRAPVDALLVEALSSAALVKYGRAFGSGVRMKVPDEILVSLPIEQRERHDLFKALRDKWIAHSINSFEDNRVVAYLAPPERGGPCVSSISVQHTIVLSLSCEQAESLRKLAALIEQKLATLLAAENALVLGSARQVEPATLYAQVDPSPTSPSSTDPRVRRPKW